MILPPHFDAKFDSKSPKNRLKPISGIGSHDCLRNQTPFNDPYFAFYGATGPLTALTAERFAERGKMKDGLLFGSYLVVNDLVLGKDSFKGSALPKEDVLAVGRDMLPFPMADALENCATSPIPFEWRGG